MPTDPESQGKPGSKLAFLLYFGANLVPRFAMFASMLVLTRVFPISEYGLFVLVVTTGEILESTTATVCRLLLIRTEAGRGFARPRALRRARNLSIGAVLLSASATVPIGLALEWDRAAAFAVATIAYVASFSLLRFFLTLLQIGQAHAAYNRTEMLRGLSILVATTIGPLIDSQSFFPTSLTMSLGTAAIAAWGLARSRAPVGGKARLRLKPVLLFGVPIVLSFAVMFALRSAGQYALEAAIGLAAVGIFAAADSLARQPVELVTGALNTYTYPSLLRRQATEGLAGVASAQVGILLTMTALGIGIVALMFAVSGPVAALFLPDAYRAAGEMMPWITLGSFCYAVKQFVFDNGFHITKRYWLLLASSALPAAAGIPVTLAFIIGLGLQGAALGFAAASIISMLLSALISRRVLVFSIPLLRISAITLAAGLAGAATWAAAGFLSGAGLLVLLAGSTALFMVVYAAALTCVGISVMRLLTAPWDPLRPKREKQVSEAAGLTPGARPL